MYTREDILAYRCPRWGDWPKLDLYMDQAVSLIEESVRMFYGDSQPKPVTSTMINNYVKQKIVPPSRKKKYGRDHLAYFYMIFLLKSTISLIDISDALEFFQKQQVTPETYDIFCDEIEAALSIAFNGEMPETRSEIPGIEIIRGFSLAFAYTLLARSHNMNSVKV
ncbi:MAG: DUF1836 domain-containing protein [Clostridiales bacterium]|jgi:hypothetical protein|nr:DUF1836 domain-containing protein [Clostridiales bacterium]